MDQLIRSPTEKDTGPEKILWQGAYSGKAMIGTWLSCIVITAALIAGAVLIPSLALVVTAVVILVWIGSLLRMAYKKLSMSYELTDRKFVHRSGILVRSIDRIELFEIKDVTTRQGLIQNMFNVGSVHIVSADQSHPELTLEGIADPQRVADLIDDTSRPVRERRTLITS